jgi:uncharacterized membrane protein YobD (UPF0266 family)
MSPRSKLISGNFSKKNSISKSLLLTAMWAAESYLFSGSRPLIAQGQSCAIYSAVFKSPSRIALMNLPLDVRWSISANRRFSCLKRFSTLQLNNY